MKRPLLLSLLLSTLLVSSALAAQRSYVLEYSDQAYSGQNVLHLKQALQRVYPNITTDRVNLLNVRLIAKSRGSGRAWLVVNGVRTMDQLVPGNVMNFDVSSEWTFSKIDFQNPSYDNDFGAWQIFLGGPIKVRRVVVQLEDIYAPVPPAPPGSQTGRNELITCQSEDYQPKSCYMRRQIADANIVLQLSTGRGTCHKWQDWGFSGNILWVRNGCRAQFRVYYYRY